MGIIDGTLLPTGDRADHRDDHSGKRRRSGPNVQVMSDLDGQLLAVSMPTKGSTPDRRACTITGCEDTLAEYDILGDKAYRGTSVIATIQKPYRGDFSPGHIDHNHQHSARRAAVERCIAHLKHRKMTSTRYRGPYKEFPAVIRIITTLEFYRLGW
ncbi:transposase family protein [Actinokineospora auranticolor]|uniref:transposase family protein n=1 Tax=Actinokineospora auranticolor TaxID=155976 RepID=UPI0015E3D474|nr:transposase family protein [Actinokineospora auranticolor]